MTEVELTAQLRGYLEADGWWCVCEVPLVMRWVDLVAIRSGEVLAIEVKLRNWKRALEQAIHYALAANRAYIAMPTDRLNSIDWHKANSWGVGVIAVRDDGYDILLEPLGRFNEHLVGDIVEQAKLAQIWWANGHKPGWAIMND